jgi:hypothetical protein
MSIFRLIFFLFTILSSSALAIDVSDNVSGIWGPEDNPYNVVGDLRIPQDSTLTIEPGCYIKFAGHYKFVVDTNALLIAAGAESDSIYFTAADTAIGWAGIRYRAASSDCRLSYCILEWGRENGQFGGALSCQSTTLILGHCLIRNCHAFNGYGGGIYIENGALDIFSSSLINNYCSFGGAAIYAISSDIDIQNNNVLNNETWYELGGDRGGAIVIESCTPAIIRNNIIKGNYAGSGGGGLYIVNCTAHICNNIVVGNNSAFEGGGGISVGNSTVQLEFNLITHNMASDGGGILGHASHLTILNNTISFNSVYGNGGGFISFRDTNTILTNNIIWGNTSYWNNQIYASDETIAVAEYNDIQGGWPGIGNIDADPLFVYPDTGNFHLSWANWPSNDSSKSPCIDTGDPASPLDSDGTRADMGAFYFDQRGGGVDDLPVIPHAFGLMQNYPNPFNSSTILRYDLPMTSSVTIDIYDILGRKVETLLVVKKQAGSHQVTWEAAGFSSGIYFYRLQAADKSYSRPMTVIK